MLCVSSEITPTKRHGDLENERGKQPTNRDAKGAKKGRKPEKLGAITVENEDIGTMRPEEMDFLMKEKMNKSAGLPRQSSSTPQRTGPCCTICNEPMKGHLQHTGTARLERNIYKNRVTVTEASKSNMGFSLGVGVMSNISVSGSRCEAYKIKVCFSMLVSWMKRMTFEPG